MSQPQSGSKERMREREQEQEQEQQQQKETKTKGRQGWRDREKKQKKKYIFRVFLENIWQFYSIVFVFIHFFFITLCKACTGRNLGKSESEREGKREPNEENNFLGEILNVATLHCIHHCVSFCSVTNSSFSNAVDTETSSLLLLAFWKWTFSPSTQWCSNSFATNILLGLSQNLCRSHWERLWVIKFLECHIILLFLKREGSF